MRISIRQLKQVIAEVANEFGTFSGDPRQARSDSETTKKLQQHIYESAEDWRAPEYASIETFAEYLIDDERDEYTHEDLAALNRRLRMPVHSIRKELDSYGFKLATRSPERHVRGFGTSSHDRWYGPGALKTHGGAGIDPSTGRATTGKTI